MRTRSVVASSLVGSAMLLAACGSTPSTTTKPAKAKAATTGGLPIVCAQPTDINGHPTITCTWEISAQANPSSLISQINSWLSTSHSRTMSAGSQVWIEAWGGKGAGSTNSGCVNGGGAGGTAGYAQTITNEGALSQVQKLYLYVAVEGATYTSSGVSCHGGGGASSTLVTTVRISSSSFSFASDTLAIAGGGGGGSGQCDVPSTDGHGGGGVAIATGSSPVSVGGDNGGGHHAGAGGNSNRSTTGDASGGGGGGGSGHPGVGGSGNGRPYGASTYTAGWISASSADPNLGSYTAGSGAGKGDNSSGSGGGGYGGGGTGDTCSGTSDSAGSGGGGGSYAAGVTTTDPNAPTNEPSNPDGSFGAVSLVFNLSSTQDQ